MCIFIEINQNRDVIILNKARPTDKNKKPNASKYIKSMFISFCIKASLCTEIASIMALLALGVVAFGAIVAAVVVAVALAELLCCSSSLSE